MLGLQSRAGTLALTAVSAWAAALVRAEQGSALARRRRAQRWSSSSIAHERKVVIGPLRARVQRRSAARIKPSKLAMGMMVVAGTPATRPVLAQRRPVPR